MGREKYYRHRTRYLIERVAKKGLEAILERELIEEFGVSRKEAEVLAYRSTRHLLRQAGFLLPNQIIIEARAGRNNFGKAPGGEMKLVRITPVAPEDLELYREYGLPALQARRLVRVIREAYQQDALLSRKFLGVLFCMSSGALRRRLARFTKLGLRLPYQGQSRKMRQMECEDFSTFAIREILSGESPEKLRRKLCLPRRALEQELNTFSQYCHLRERGQGPGQKQIEELLSLPAEILEEWDRLRDRKRFQRHVSFLMKRYSEAKTIPAGRPGEDRFHAELKEGFGFSRVKARLWCERLDELRITLEKQRNAGDIIYPAVSVEEPPGKPLADCRMVPVVLQYLVPDEFHRDSSSGGKIDRVSPIKFEKMLRYTTSARVQGGVLTQGDLSYLLGVHTSCLRRLMTENRTVILPTRGRERDIGPAVSHKQKIVELYLQMYTETEISRRTGHCYKSVEQYIKDFSAVMCLRERGLNAVMIRKVMGRSLRLIEAYLELYRKYNTKDYAFRLAHLRRIFEQHRHEYGEGKKIIRLRRRQ